MRAAKHAAIARNGEHDGDRIGAREMLGLARRAVAPPAGFTGCVAEPQFGQKRVARMPVEQCLPSASGGRWSASIMPRTAIERRSVTSKALSSLSAVAVVGSIATRKQWRAIDQPQKSGFRCAREAARRPRR